MAGNTALKKKIISGVLWNGTGRIAMKSLRFVIAVILARLLAPEQFGIVAIATFFLGLCETFIDCGFGNALVQRQNLTEAECSSVFWVNLVSALLFYLVLFFAAPGIADFYQTPVLAPLLRVIGLVLIISSITIVPKALLVKRLDFKHNAIVRWIGLSCAGIAAIALALAGYGIWALAAEYIVGETVKMILYPCFCKNRIRFHLDLREIKDVFNFGYKLLGGNILGVIQKNLSTLVLGKLVSIEQMSFFARGYAYPQLLSDTMDGMFHDVIFSAMSASQKNAGQLRQIRNGALQVSTYISFPALLLLAVTAGELIPLMLTEKWTPCVIFLQIACFDIAVMGIWGILQQQFNAIGRSDLTVLLRLIFFGAAAAVFAGFGICRKVCGTSVPMLGIGLALIGANSLCMIPLFVLSRKYLQFSFFGNFLPCIGKNLLVSCGCGGIVLAVSGLLPAVNPLFRLGGKIVVFGGLYLLGSRLFHLTGYACIMELVHKRRNSAPADGRV